MSLAGSGKPVVYLAFSDETGTGDIQTQPIIVVAAVTINPDTQWNDVHSHMNRLVETLVPENQRENFEFHASKLFGKLKRGNNEALLRGLLQIPVQHRLSVTYGAIDRKGFIDQIGPTRCTSAKEQIKVMQSMAFSVCALKIDNWMRQFAPKEKLLWIADNTTSDELMKHGLKLWQKDAMFADIPTSKFEHVMDTIYFGHSHQSRGLQLADACNFVIRHHIARKAEIEPFYRLIQPIVNTSDVLFARR